MCVASLRQFSRRRRETESEEGVVVAHIRHETMRANHGQDEGMVMRSGGPHPPMLQNWGKSCG